MSRRTPFSTKKYGRKPPYEFIGLRVPKGLHDFLLQRALSSNTTLSDLVRDVLIEYKGACDVVESSQKAK